MAIIVVGPKQSLTSNAAIEHVIDVAG